MNFADIKIGGKYRLSINDLQLTRPLTARELATGNDSDLDCIVIETNKYATSNVKVKVLSNSAEYWISHWQLRFCSAL